MPEDVQMHVHVDQSRHDRHSIRVDDRGASRHRQLSLPTDGRDAVTGDQHHAILDHRPSEAIDDPPSHDCHGDGRSLSGQRAGSDSSEEKSGKESRDAHSVLVVRESADANLKRSTIVATDSTESIPRTLRPA